MDTIQSSYWLHLSQQPLLYIVTCRIISVYLHFTPVYNGLHLSVLLLLLFLHPLLAHLKSVLPLVDEVACARLVVMQSALGLAQLHLGLLQLCAKNCYITLKLCTENGGLLI